MRFLYFLLGSVFGAYLLSLSWDNLTDFASQDLLNVINKNDKLEYRIVKSSIKGNQLEDIDVAKQDKIIAKNTIKSEVDIISEIKDLSDQKNWTEIIKLLSNKSNTNNEEIVNVYLVKSYYSLVDDYLDNKEFESAITLLGQAIYTEHRIYRLLKIKLAEVYHVYGKTWAGVEVLLDLLETSTDTNEENNILELKNRYLSEQETFLKSNKLWTGLVGFYQKLSYNNNLDFEIKIKLAETYLKIGNTDESERIINVILQNNPDNIKAIAIKEYIVNELTVPDVITEGKIPIEFVGDSIYIQVMFENKYEVKMLLDTGASMIHISQKLQQLIGIKLNEEVSVRNFITASGRIALPIYKIKSLAVGKFEVKNIEVASMATTLQNNAQGILGMSYLKNYIFSIDTDNSVLELKTK